MELLRLGAGRSAELTSQPLAKRLVDDQGFGRVAACGERLHQKPVSALAIGRAGDQVSRGALRSVQLPSADLDACTANELECAHEDLLESAALLVNPALGAARQELSRGDVLCHAAGSPGGSEVALCDGTLGAVQAFGSRFDVYPRGSG